MNSSSAVKISIDPLKHTCDTDHASNIYNGNVSPEEKRVTEDSLVYKG